MAPLSLGADHVTVLVVADAIVAVGADGVPGTVDGVTAVLDGEKGAVPTEFQDLISYVIGVPSALPLSYHS